MSALPSVTSLSRLKPYGWSLGSQGLASATNLALNVQVARHSTAAGFGAFSVSLSLLLLFVVGIRGLMAEPFAVSWAEREEREGAANIDRSTLSISSTLGLATGGVTLLVSFFVVPIGRATVMLAVAAPIVVTHDVARGMLLGRHRPRAACATDAAWATVQLLSYLAAALFGVSGFVAAVLAWALGAMAALAVASALLGSLPVPSIDFRGSGHHFRLGIIWAIDYLSAAGTLNVLIVVLSAWVGLASVAALRGALVLVGPSTVVIGGIRNMALPSLATAAVGDLPRAARRVGLGMAAAVALSMSPALFLSDRAGVALLGDTWLVARHVLPLVIAQRCIVAAADGFVLGLRVVRTGNATLVVRGGVTILTVTAGIIGATVAAAYGAAVGLVIAGLVTLPVWERLLISRIRTATAPSGDP